jgi:PAS domain S-box-containing protein
MGDIEAIGGEQRRIAEIGRIVSSTLDLDEVFTPLVEQTRKLFHFDRIVISVFTDDKTEYVDQFVSGLDFEGAATGARKPTGPYETTGSVIEQKEHLLISGPELEKYAAENESEAVRYASGLRSLLIVPLVWQDDVQGIITFRAYDPEAFGEHQINLAVQISRQTAGAISTSNRYAIAEQESVERQQLAEEQTRIAEIGRVVSSSPNLDDVFSAFANQANKLVPFDRLSISTIEPNAGLIFSAHVAGLRTDVDSTNAPNSLEDSSIPAAVYKDHEVVAGSAEILASIANSDVAMDTNVLISAGLKSALFAPVVQQGQLVGTLAFRSKEDDPYGEREKRLAMQIANQIAGVISSNQQFALLERQSAEHQKMAEEHARIADIGRIVSSTLDTQDVLTAFVEQARSLVPFDRIALVVVNDAVENELSISSVLIDGIDVKGTSTGVTVSQDINVPQREVIEQKKLFVANGDAYVGFIESAPGEQNQRDRGLNSVLFVPLVWQGRAIGSMNLRSIDPYAYDDHAIDLAQQIGAQIAGAIATSAQYRRLELALLNNQTQVAALEAADDAIVIRNSDMTVEYVNPAFEAQTGFSSEEVLGTVFKYPEPTKPLDSRAQSIESAFEYVQQGTVWHEYVNGAHKDGTEYLLDATMSAIFNDKGELDKYVGIHRDVTGRFKVNAEIRTQAAALEAASDAVAILSLDFTIEWVNQALVRDTGYSKEEVVGQHGPFLRSDKNPSEMLDGMLRQVLSGKA